MNQQKSAIVSSCGVGRGVVGNGGAEERAVIEAGGPNLSKDRGKLNLNPGSHFCAEGDAVMIGPNDYGRLEVPHVIFFYANRANNHASSLSSAYSAGLECAKSEKLEAVAFCVISPGGLGGKKTYGEVATIGLNAIQQFDGYEELKSVYLFGYKKNQAARVDKLAKAMFPSTYMTHSMGASPPPTTKSRPLFGKGVPFSDMARYNMPGKFPFCLVVAKGQISDFSYSLNYNQSAIVNSSDEECLGDNVVSLAGGPSLLDDRCKLPTKYSASRNRQVRCPVGSAVITGPNNYGNLKVPFVIHAFGGFEDDTLASAYSSSLECGKNNQIEAIAFSLLSTGNYRGSRSTDEVITIGLKSIQRFSGYDQLKAVYMVASTETEAICLLKLSSEILDSPASVSTLAAKNPTSLFKRINIGKKNSGEHGNGLDAQQEKYFSGHEATTEQNKPVEEGVNEGHCRGKSIDYTNEGFEDEDTHPISEALENTSAEIASVYLNGNRLCMLDVRFTRALAHSQHVKLLWLENNQIGMVGADRLADALMLNGTLQSFYLGKNRLGDYGAQRLSYALQVNRSIKTIDLHDNGIGDVAAEQIAEALIVNRSLQSVNLRRNLITDDGAGFLAEALRTNTVVETLELAYNPISESLQQGICELLSEPRSITLNTHTRRKSSLFFTKLMELEKDTSEIFERLEVLSRIITDVYMMRFFYTTISILQKSGVLSNEEASNYIQKGLHETASVCTCGDSISSFKLILEKAGSDEYIQRYDFHRFDNQAEVARMESAPFIADIRESIARNTARINGLEANVEAVHCSLSAMRDGLKRQMKIEATVGLVCAALNAISFGVGGSILDATMNALGSIVDYSDLTHIQTVAAQWGEGFVEQVETGIDLASNEYAEKSLQEAVKRGHTFTVVSATAAMISVQYPFEVASSHPKEEKLPEKTQEKMSPLDKLSQFLTEEESNKEVMLWLASHLPKLRQEDAIRYCECLVEDGFDSEDMLADIEEEDLHFMKKAHKRKLFQRMQHKTDD